MTVGLLVVDQETYAQYRKEMRPLLDEAGGAFRYDFDVARTLQSENGADINRTFVLKFPSQSNKERFFADPRYAEIKRRLFDPSVKQRVFISEYTTDGSPLRPVPTP
jgi:uncharacterized protein (DUF1330 family)